MLAETQEWLARRQLALNRAWDLFMCACMAARAAGGVVRADRLQHGLVLGDGRAPGRRGSRNSRPGARTAGRGARSRSSARCPPAPRCRRPGRWRCGRRVARERRDAAVGVLAALRRSRSRIACDVLALGAARGERGDLAFDQLARADQLQRTPFGGRHRPCAAVGACRRGPARRCRSRCAPRPSLRPRARSAPRAPRAGSRPAAWPGRVRPAGGCRARTRRPRSANAAARRSAGTGVAVRRFAAAWMGAAGLGLAGSGQVVRPINMAVNAAARHRAKP